MSLLERPQPADAVFKHALRLLGREVGLREAARHLELTPWRREDANRLFAVASLLRLERLDLLVRAGLIESAERWTR